MTTIQKDADAAISPAIGGKYSAVIATYLYDYDALQLIKYASVTSHSDSTPNMVKALEGLGSHTNTNTGTFIVPNPGFTSSNHGLSSPMYSVNIHGDYVSGTFPTNGNTPIADCLK